MLKGEAQGVTARYEQIRFELQEVSMESPEHYNQNWSKGLLIFMQSQAVIKLVRQAAKILHKERLLLTIQELVDLKLKLIERQQQGRAILREQATQRDMHDDKSKKSSSSRDSDEETEVSNLKHALLQDICKILIQKMVLYSLQLRVYEKEEMQIVFEELWEDTYRKHLQMVYFEQIKKFLSVKRQDRQMLLEVVGRMRMLKLSQLFKAWRLARPKRIAYQTRIYNSFNYIAERKQRTMFFKLQYQIKQKVAARLDKRLLKKYFKYRSHHKLFLKWSSR